MIEAWVNAASWVTIIDCDHGTFDDSLRAVVYGGHALTERHGDAIETFFHETVHFWQAISTNFCYEYSTRLLFANIEYLRRLSKPECSISDANAAFNETATGLPLMDGSEISTIDLIEGAAVFIAFRVLSYEDTHEAFLCHLADRHANQPRYRKAYDCATDYLGRDTYEVFSVLCYVSLQAHSPSKEFLAMLTRLSSLRKSDPAKYGLAVGAEATSTITGLSGVASEDFFLPYVVRHPGKMQNMVLHPYIEFSRGVSGLDQNGLALMQEFFARPHAHLRNSFARFPSEMRSCFFFSSLHSLDETSHFVNLNDYRYFRLAAPLRIHFNPAEATTYYGRTTFPRRVSIIKAGYAKWDSEYADGIAELYALVGMCQLLRGSRDPSKPFFCRHNQCFVHSSRLCCDYVWYPDVDERFESCRFPSMVSSSQVSLDQLLLKTTASKANIGPV